MTTLTIKNVPDTLHARLLDMARRDRRSLNGELLVLLEEAASRSTPSGEEREAFLERMRAVRARMKGAGLTMKEIQKAIDGGRP